MSTLNPTNLHSAVAFCLADNGNLSTEQELFRKALNTVEEQRRKAGKLPEVFDNLNHARTIDDVRFLLQNDQASSAIWKKPVGRSWLKIFSKYAEHMWCYKNLLNGIGASSSSLVSPITGSILFVINIFKEIGVAIQYLENTETTLKSSIRRFGRYLQDGVKMSNDLQDALLDYYEVVIGFVIDVHGEFTSSFLNAAIRVVHRTLQAKLKEFNDRIHHIIDHVDKGASIDSMQGIMSGIVAVNEKLSHPLPASYTALPRGLHMFHGLPRINPNFTGQKDYLYKIWDLLNDNPRNKNLPRHQRRTAIYGMGGIGKTQILLKFAYDHLDLAARSRSYDTVIWINAVSDISIASALSSFMEMNCFPEPLVNDHGGPDYTAFFLRLKQHSKNWLLIFDNVKDAKTVYKAIPPGNEGHVLFSTRHKFVAGQLADASQNLEIVQMDEVASIQLVLNLAASSDLAEDRDATTVRSVAEFSGGLPLLMEQIVHLAILGGRSLALTLKDVRKSVVLLRQKNLFSLHEDDLSIGAIVTQTLDTLESRFPKAEALLKVLIHFDPSSIPVSLFQDCVGQVQQALNRLYTYDRGAVDQTRGRVYDRKTFLTVPEVRQRESSRHRLRSLSSLRRSLSRPSEDPLPVDDIEPASSLRHKFCDGTPMRQLFEDQTALDGAFDVLVNAAIVRRLNDRDFWLHDRISEVARAVLSVDVVSHQHMALAAATMVYIASPSPHGGSMNRGGKTSQYLPHIMACHKNLEDLGMLNNCSLGPELSHLIASALDGLYLWNRSFDHYGIAPSIKQRTVDRAQISDYYQQAYAGYMAGWRRLKHNHNIDDETIAHHIRIDREHEKSLGGYGVDRYMIERQRLGRNAPWRAMQTACRLSDWLQQDPATRDQALLYARIAIKFCTTIFGHNDEDTVKLKRTLGSMFQRYGLWQEAYDVAIDNIKEWLERRPTDQKYRKFSSKININEWLDWHPTDQKYQKSVNEINIGNLWKDKQSSEFADDLSICCIGLARDSSSTPAKSSSWAREAVMWTRVPLQYGCELYGEDEICNRRMMSRLAEAYQMTGNFSASVYWYGEAVLCALAQMVWEYEEWDSGPGVGAVQGDGDVLQTSVVRAFEEAMLRHISGDNARLGDFDELDFPLRKYLCAVESKIALWRADRERHGLWHPLKDELDRIQREYEEEEERIRLQEEMLYGVGMDGDGVDKKGDVEGEGEKE